MWTQPWRLDRNAHSGTNPVGFDRESHLLCAFLVCCYELIQPRSRMPKAAKPASAFKIIDGVRSCHRRAGIFMVSTKQLTTAMKEITAEHIKEHGSESLLPERKDPTGPTLYRQLLRTPEGTNLGAKELHWSSQTFLSLGAMFVLSGNTGFRKAKVALPSGCDFDDRRLRRSSLLGGIDVTLHVDPSPEQLRTLVRGRDKAVIKPPRSEETRAAEGPKKPPKEQVNGVRCLAAHRRPGPIPAHAARWKMEDETKFSTLLVSLSSNDQIQNPQAIGQQRTNPSK